MRVITASTPEQHQYIKELILHLQTVSYPKYFTKSYIEELVAFNLLTSPTNLEDLSMTAVLEITAALQTVSTVLETINPTEIKDYEQVFNQNIDTLKKYEINVPFYLRDLFFKDS